MTQPKRDITAEEQAIGARLKKLRKAKMTQTELVKRLQHKFGNKIAQSYVSDWEAGRMRLHGELIVELCRILETDANTLLGTDHPLLSKRMAGVLDDMQTLPKRQQEVLIKAFKELLAERLENHQN